MQVELDQVKKTEDEEDSSLSSSTSLEEISKHISDSVVEFKDELTTITSNLKKLDSTFDEFLDDELGTATKRKVLRVFFATCCLIIIALAVGLSQISISRTETFSFDTSGAGINIQSDACTIRTSAQNRNNFEFEISLPVGFSNIDIDFDTSSNSLTIQNRRNLANRYLGYFCDIELKYPQTNPVPSLRIEAMGTLQTRFSVGSQVYESLDLRSQGAHFFVFLDQVTVGSLNSSFLDGDFQIVNSTINSANVMTSGAPIIWSLNNDIAFSTSVPSSNLCLSSYNNTCNMLANTTLGCDALLMSSSPTSTPASIATAAPISISCTSCFVNLIVANDNGFGALNTFNNSAAPIGFSAESVDRLRRVFFDAPVPEFVAIEINGQGLPSSGRWIWSTRFLYIVFPLTFLDITTYFLVSPSTRIVNVTLSPSFCPPLRTSSPVLENLVAVDQLLRTTITPTPAPVSIWAFQDFQDQSRLSSTEYIVFQDRNSGEDLIESPNFTNFPELTTILVVDLLLVFSTTSFVFVIGVHRARKWGYNRIEEWGQIYFAEKWPENRAEFHSRAGLVFLSEFLIGFPRERRRVFKTFLTVVLHMSILLLIVAPLLSLAGTLDLSTSRRFGDPEIPPFSVFLYIACAIYGFLALLYLYGYYLHLPWKYFKWYATPFFVLTGIFSYLSLFHMVNVAYWMLLGALISPNDVLPFASVVIVLAVHLYLTVYRVYNLVDNLQDEINTQKDKQDEMVKKIDQPATAAPTPTLAPAPTTYTVKSQLTAAQLTGFLSENKFLELRDISVRAAILKELTTFAILVFFFVFMLVAYTSLSSSTDVAAGVSTILPFLLVGGLNFNLGNQDPSRQNFKNRVAKARKEAAEEETKKPESKKDV